MMGELRFALQEVRDRQLRLELRLDGMDASVSARAQAAARGGAAVAAATALAGLSERIALVEHGVGPGREILNRHTQSPAPDGAT
jgi:hypothetical protein